MRRSYESREARFSAQVLQRWIGAKLPTGFAAKAAEKDKAAEVLIYDEIGYFGLTAKAFMEKLAEVGSGPLTVRLNSPGGDVFDGLAIYNALKARAEPVTVHVDGIAASIASVIAMAGGNVIMAEQSMMMLHNCWGLVIGNRHDMLETAAVMEKIDGQIADTYARKSGKKAPEMSAVMDAETWYTAEEAVDAGLADEIAKAPKIEDSIAQEIAYAAAAEEVKRLAALAASEHDTRMRRLRLAEAEAA